MTQFQAQCRKLPKALRDWHAYVDLRKKIDEFLEMLPLIQALAAHAMRPGTGPGFQEITGVRAGPERGDVQAPERARAASILKHAEDIEELHRGCGEGGAGGDQAQAGSTATGRI